ncbi:hypothetical protein T459_21892 [Capsicum annuum]|uniref:Uncharacterized protein n=1 Tax=Capsicum annuum TaxID=4072 RepID=A0A2G2YYB8_CAPAN|nr:hypothetical protein T459_21892 [Capsicum annuum]
MDEFLDMEKLGAPADAMTESSAVRRAPNSESVLKSKLGAKFLQTRDWRSYALTNMEAEKLKQVRHVTECKGELKIFKELSKKQIDKNRVMLINNKNNAEAKTLRLKTRKDKKLKIDEI